MKWRTEAAIAGLLMVLAGVWSTQFWNTWVRQGGQPEFYQVYFEPAVMVACGRGFGVTAEQPKPLEDFLWRRTDTLECGQLPADLVLDGRVYQAAWKYLLYTVGSAWRVMGVSWSGMAPIFGAFFATMIGLAYGIFRLGMGRAVSVACAMGVATSSLHLLNLPHLRDYSKAPFTLALVLILGWMVVRPLRPRVLLALAAAYGAVLGIGYGFRTDLLINLPLLVVTVFVFMEGGLTRNLLVKTAATAVFLASFTVASWPITSAVYEKGGCQWHVALLGLQSPFDARLGLESAPVSVGYAYADGYVIRAVQGFAHRTDPTAPTPAYCSRDYDVQSGRYLMATAATIPGDLVARAYASTLEIIELPFSALGPPVRDWMAPLFELRLRLMYPRLAWGALFTALALAVASAGNVRIAFFLAFLLAYVGGYPAVQFQERHFFHLEFIGWWAMGFLAHQAVTWLVARRRGEAGLPIRAAMMQVAIVFTTSLVVVVGALGVSRWLQQVRVTQLIEAYEAAPKLPIEHPFQPLVGIGESEWPQVVEVVLDESACGSRPAVTFAYDRTLPDGDFTTTVTLREKAREAGATRIILPVFERYTGLTVEDAPPGCVVGVFRFAQPEAFPLLLGATLQPGWASRPLYARIARWERD